MIWEYHRDPRIDIQALVAPQGRRVLDVGCGAGALSKALKAAGAAWVAGIEGNPEAAEEARKGLDLVVAGDLRDVALPFAAGEFDYLVFADVLEHVPEPERALARYLPLLAPGGHVVISVPNMRFYLVLWRLIVDRWEYAPSGVRDRTHLRIFTKRSLLAMVDGAGLELVRLARNLRFFDDQSRVSRAGVVASRIAVATAGRVFDDLMAYQYVALARKPAR